MKNNKATIAFIFSMISLALMLFWPSAATIKIAIVLSVVFAVLAIILGFMGKKASQETEKGKNLSIAALIIGFVLAAFGLLGLLGMSLFDNPIYTREVCKQTQKINNCIVTNGENATCKIVGSTEIVCPVDVLVDSQYAH